MADPPATDNDGDAPFAAARRKRLALQDAMTGLERVAASPSGAAAWSQQVLEAVVALHASLRDHVTEVESSDGLLVTALDAAPRLAPMVDRLHEDHVDLERALADLERRLQRPDAVDAAVVRGHIMAVLGRVAAHRQLGSDLVYEAYDVDIGGAG